MRSKESSCGATRNRGKEEESKEGQGEEEGGEEEGGEEGGEKGGEEGGEKAGGQEEEGGEEERPTKYEGKTFTIIHTQGTFRQQKIHHLALNLTRPAALIHPLRPCSFAQDCKTHSYSNSYSW